MLEKLISGQKMILPTRRLASDGLKAWEEAVGRGYEGIVGKALSQCMSQEGRCDGPR